MEGGEMGQGSRYRNETFGGGQDVVQTDVALCYYVTHLRLIQCYKPMLPPQEMSFTEEEERLQVKLMGSQGWVPALFFGCCFLLLKAYQVILCAIKPEVHNSWGEEQANQF